MNAEDFNQVVETILDSTRGTLVKKAGEYATDTDRLHNFKIAGPLQGRTPAQALGGMLAKHTTSIFDMIAAGDTTKYTTEMWDEKIGDHINYLVLLRAIVEEERRTFEAGKPQNASEIFAMDNDQEHRPDVEFPGLFHSRQPKMQTNYKRTPHNRRLNIPLHVDEIVLPDREAAEKVLEELKQIIEARKFVSVYELFELVGVTGTFGDQEWGWDSVMGAGIDRVREGYLLNLPKPKRLTEILSNPIEDKLKAGADQTALNDIAAHLARLSKAGRPFRKTDLNEIYNVVERVRVVEPDANV